MSKGKKLLRTLGKKAGVSDYDWENKVDFSKPEEVEQYLRDNMAEGYLAQEEEAFIEELVSIYSDLLSVESEFDEILKQVQSNKVS